LVWASSCWRVCSISAFVGLGLVLVAGVWGVSVWVGVCAEFGVFAWGAVVANQMAASRLMVSVVRGGNWVCWVLRAIWAATMDSRSAVARSIHRGGG
jgi:hypothetical protein